MAQRDQVDLHSSALAIHEAKTAIRQQLADIKAAGFRSFKETCVEFTAAIEKQRQQRSKTAVLSMERDAEATTSLLFQCDNKISALEMGTGLRIPEECQASLHGAIREGLSVEQVQALLSSMAHLARTHKSRVDFLQMFCDPPVDVLVEQSFNPPKPDPHLARDSDASPQEKEEALNEAVVDSQERKIRALPRLSPMMRSLSLGPAMLSAISEV